jgi:hypothetical protein
MRIGLTVSLFLFPLPVLSSYIEQNVRPHIQSIIHPRHKRTRESAMTNLQKENVVRTSSSMEFSPRAEKAKLAPYRAGLRPSRCVVDRARSRRRVIDISRT